MDLYFFLKFRKKHLFITTCIEKHCNRPLIKYIYYTSYDAYVPKMTKKSRDLA